jgi:hypothetical protein
VTRCYLLKRDATSYPPVPGPNGRPRGWLQRCCTASFVAGSVVIVCIPSIPLRVAV